MKPRESRPWGRPRAPKPAQTDKLPGERQYWLIPDQICCGSYPAAKLASETQEMGASYLMALLAQQITAWIDLTERDERYYGNGASARLVPYAPQLLEVADDIGMQVQYCRMPIPDGRTPTIPQMAGILDTIDAAWGQRQRVVVHCAGGVGRTGTVAACWLIRHGRAPEAALAQIRTTRTVMYNGSRVSPETIDQMQFVEQWDPRW